MPEIIPGEALYRPKVSTLAQQLLSPKELSRCVFFTGSGMGVGPGYHLPTGAELADMLARDSGIDFPKPMPLSTVAFYYEFYKSRLVLNEFLKSRLAADEIPVSPATSRLVDLVLRLEELGKQPILIITTNYDQHFEKLYQQRSRRPLDVVVYNGGRDANQDGIVLHNPHRSKFWRPDGTCLYKMHGCISSPGDEQSRNMVITEDDYINFLSNCLSEDPRKRVAGYVFERLSESPIIFLGYSLSDWNFRVIFKTTAERHLRECYAVQKRDPSDQYWKALVEFWGKRSFWILNHTAEEFLADLSAAVEEQVHASGAVAAGR